LNLDNSRELAMAAADLAADGKALGIVILDLHEVSSVADYFVLASGRSHIQVESICDRIAEGVHDKLDEKPLSVEGLENALWAVIDYGSVVVHVFQESVREIYDLERLWSLAPRWRYEDGPLPRTPLTPAGPAAPARKKAGSTGRTAAARKKANGSAGVRRTAGA